MGVTTISWTHTRRADGSIVPGYTFNPWIGCTKVSPACDGCYAEALMDKRYHRVQWGPHGQRVRTSISNWRYPAKWQRDAEVLGDRPFVFCASLADIFDNQVPPEWRNDLFDLMRLTPNLVYLLLTKRPQNILKQSVAAGGLPDNAALGTTIEDQIRAETNVPHLLKAKEILKPQFAFVSCEPLLGPIDLMALIQKPGCETIIDALQGFVGHNAGPDGDGRIMWEGAEPCPKIDWVITGGETDQGGHKARPSNPRWFRALRDQCELHGTAYHHKQNGEWVSVSEVEGAGEHFSFPDGATVRRVGKNNSGRTIDHVTHDAYPHVAA